MKAAILTVLILLGLIDNEVLSFIVIAPIAFVGLGMFFIKAGEGGAFK